MRILQKMPRSGQFIAVWIHNDKIWSHNLIWEGGELYRLYDGKREKNPTPSDQKCLKEAFFLVK